MITAKSNADWPIKQTQVELPNIVGRLYSIYNYSVTRDKSFSNKYQSIRIGPNLVSDIKIGNNFVNEVFVGDTLVYSSVDGWEQLVGSDYTVCHLAIESNQIRYYSAIKDSIGDFIEATKKNIINTGFYINATVRENSQVVTKTSSNFRVKVWARGEEASVELYYSGNLQIFSYNDVQIAAYARNSAVNLSQYSLNTSVTTLQPGEFIILNEDVLFVDDEYSSDSNTGSLPTITQVAALKIQVSNSFDPLVVTGETGFIQKVNYA